jgi:biotin synthase
MTIHEAPVHLVTRAAPQAAPTDRWQVADIEALFELPFTELMFRAQTVHRAHFDPAEVQLSTLLSIKTGGCPEDCSYCPQAARYDTGVEAGKLMDTEAVLDAARRAQEAGASRFCMGAAWRSPKRRDIEAVSAMIREVRALGLETCAEGVEDAEAGRLLDELGCDTAQGYWYGRPVPAHQLTALLSDRVR